jgi:hypothetical protein
VVLRAADAEQQSKYKLGEVGGPMKKCVAILILIFASALIASAQQTDCPASKVCIDQTTANKLFDAVDQLIAAKDVINKMLQERNSSDATIAAANKVIEAMQQREEINGQIILKLKDLNAVYEKVIALQQTIIEKLTARLDAPRSAWSKFLSAVKTVVTLAAGIALGRGGL